MYHALVIRHCPNVITQGFAFYFYIGVKARTAHTIPFQGIKFNWDADFVTWIAVNSFKQDIFPTKAADVKIATNDSFVLLNK